MAIRTKTELRDEFKNGMVVDQVASYDLIDTLFVGVEVASSSNSLFTTVNQISSNWESVYNTVCSLSSEWNPYSAWNLTFTSIPTSSNSIGTRGNWCYENDTMYLCVCSNTWVKWAVSGAW